MRAVVADAEGRHVVTAGADGQVKVWDARKFQPLHAYFSRAPAQWLDVSQRGLLAVGAGAQRAGVGRRGSRVPGSEKNTTCMVCAWEHRRCLLLFWF